MRTAIGTNRNASMRGGNLNVEVGVAHGIADLDVYKRQGKVERA